MDEVTQHLERVLLLDFLLLEQLGDLSDPVPDILELARLLLELLL